MSDRISIPALKRLEDKATAKPWAGQGPFKADDPALTTRTLLIKPSEPNNIYLADCIYWWDRDLIAAARNALPALLRLAEAARPFVEAKLYDTGLQVNVEHVRALDEALSAFTFEEE